MFNREMNIADYDPELWKSITDETQRQEDHIELIASENYTSPRVMEAQGTQLTDKYAEGYPGKRYYGGCEFVGVAGSIALLRAKSYFVLVKQKCNRILVHKQKRLFFKLFLHPAVRFFA